MNESEETNQIQLLNLEESKQEEQFALEGHSNVPPKEYYFLCFRKKAKIKDYPDTHVITN